MNKDREFPMPIPQAHIEITECIRVDFVMFVPITRVKWKWLAIEIDSKQYHQNLEKDFQKEITMASNGYEVMRLSAEKKMLDQVRELYTKVDNIQSAIKRNRR
jgi:very-short-patch-repair endonuclease